MAHPEGGGSAVSSLQQPWQRGFSLFEVAIVAIIFSLLLAVLVERLAYYQEESERAAVQKLVANMRTALTGKVLQAEAQGKLAELDLLDGQNPIGWLQKSPDNYLGEIDNLTVKEVSPGSWYFDRSQRKLVYMFSSKKSFRGDSYERWFFRVESSRLPKKNARPNGTPAPRGGAVLSQVDGS
ncbi:type II secretion system protein [Pseudoduganella sp. LjRoot289]|uniref:type II secretion system protein n=1 Tax=Pseudoduganella sp. LjRoot289 TaxID=3342314 RepID=UPI003ED147C4